MNQELALLRRMLQIYSPSGEEGELAECLVQEMAARGFRARIDGAGNAVGYRGTGDRQIVLLGHMDTVPGVIPVEVKEGCIYGRGAVDAKGSLAAFIAAAAVAEVPEGGEIVVIGAVEEEAASSKGAYYVLDRYHPEAVIIGEPSGWASVTLGYKGRFLVRYRLVQEMGHRSGLDRSGCEKAIQFWNELTAYCEAMNQGVEGHFDMLEASLREMHSSSDGLKEEAGLNIGLRVPLRVDFADLGRGIEGLAQGAELEFYGQELPYLAGKRNALVRAFTRSIRRQGARPTFKLKTGTSDMNVVGPIWRCPIVAYGPGDSSLDHTPHEHLELEEYRKAIAVLSQVLSEL